MPYEIQFEMLPAGYVAQSARVSDATGLIRMREFTSTEDGQHFIERLEGIPNDIVDKVAVVAHLGPPDIRCLLATIRRDKTATVYLNDELKMSVCIQPKRDLAAGTAVFKDDIADVSKMSLGGIQVPADNGIVFVFSVGWRKGLFFDFEPLRPNGTPRDYDLEATLGQCYAEVMFQELFRISELIWQRMFSQQWFPFRCLTTGTIRSIVDHAKNEWPIDDLLCQVKAELSSQLPSYVNGWSQSPIFQDHITILQTAVDRYLADDFVSANSILFSRIEGIMRSLHSASGNSSKPAASNLAASVVKAPPGANRSRCPLLPDKFENYLSKVYFASFDPDAAEIPLSRHSVAHGVATAKLFSAKAATIGLMIVQQLFYYTAAHGIVRPPR